MWVSYLERSSPKPIDTYCTKGAAIMICQDEETKYWIAGKVPTLITWDGSRLKMVCRDAHPTYKGGLALGPCGRYGTLILAAS